VAERDLAYLRVTDHLRGQIVSGELAAGTRLPSQRELAAEYGVSGIIIRRALEILRTQGLVDSRQGSGTFVRRRPPVRRMSMERYLAEWGPQDRPQTSFTSDQGISWSQYRLEKAYRWIEADPRLAALFEVEAGTRVLERKFVFYVKGVPSQLSRPCLLAADVEGTPVADAQNEPWPGGTIGQLRTLGIEIDDIEEETAVRMPTPEESSTLGIGTGVPVFSITRLMRAAGRVVEVADPIVIPGDKVVRVDRLKLGG
jgi:GntR family transcriptional regulator